MIRIEEICDKVRRNHPQADLNLLRRAYLFSAREHRGQKRASGESYLVHPLEVANILADMRLDAVSVSTGLLHDVVEDTLAYTATIRDYFGEEVAHLVEGLTKIAHISNVSREEQQAENVRKMLLAMVDDVRVVLVKLADRLHNMRTLEYLDSEARQRGAQDINLDQVYDLVAARVITPNEIRHCYAALGVIHNAWKPVPGRFKDWIATPRDNLYQSLHTSVIGSKGLPFEVQIRTEEMHLIAEEGVAAHWKYKEGKRGPRDDDEALKVLRSLVEWTQVVKDSREFIDSLKLDLYPKDVYAFTPMGKVIQLPRGATPIDFAYMIHSEVGNTCTGARVNGRMIPLRTLIQNGDVVEIIRSPNAHPSRDWLNFVGTSRARNRVRHWVADQQRAESIEIGRKLFEKEAGRFQLSVKKMLGDSNGDLKRIAGEYGYGRTDDLLAAMGYGKIVPRNIIAKYLGPEKFEELDKQKVSRLRTGVRAVKRLITGDDAIVVRGVEDLMVNRARCCNPLPGEQIIGYITRGKGVAVHTARCKNVKQLMINPERIVTVEWASRPEKTAYAVKLLATTENRTGMIAGITGAISDMKTGIRDARASVAPDDKGRIEVTVEVFDVKHLDKVISSIKSVTGVLDVERLQGAV